MSGSESVPWSPISDLCSKELTMKNIDYVLNRSMTNYQFIMAVAFISEVLNVFPFLISEVDL